MSTEDRNVPFAKVQQLITIASAIFGMITPVAIFVAGYMIANSDQTKQEQNRKFDILVRVGPSLFENEPGKKILALTIIDEAGLQKELVVPVLIIAGDALRSPRG